MPYDKIDRKEADRRQKAAQIANYTEMERLKPRKSAMETFRRKPYEIDIPEAPS